jgi:hypothetical protein
MTKELHLVEKLHVGSGGVGKSFTMYFYVKSSMAPKYSGSKFSLNHDDLPTSDFYITPSSFKTEPTRDTIAKYMHKLKQHGTTDTRTEFAQAGKQNSPTKAKGTGKKKNNVEENDDGCNVM